MSKIVKIVAVLLLIGGGADPCFGAAPPPWRRPLAWRWRLGWRFRLGSRFGFGCALLRRLLRPRALLLR